MLCTVHKDNTGRLVDLIDHPELPPAGRIEPLKLAPERIPGSPGILGDRAKDGLEDRGSNLLWQTVEVPEALRRDLNLVGHLQAIFEAEPLAFGRLTTRSSDRVQEGPVLKDLDGLLERFKVFGR